MEEKNGFLKFQKNRLRQSRDIMRYVRKSPLCVALDREMYGVVWNSGTPIGNLGFIEPFTLNLNPQPATPPDWDRRVNWL